MKSRQIGGIIRKVNLDCTLVTDMKTFNLGDMVRIDEGDGGFDTVYMIKEIKKVRKGGNLYLLKSLTEDVSRLYYENNGSLLEKIS